MPSHEPEELRRMHETIDTYYPKTYLSCWAAHVRTDWAEFLDRVFLSDVIAHLGESGGSVLDLGSGPSISSIISASRWSNKIYLAELLQGNREEIEKWWRNEEDAFDWKHYFDFQGVLELCSDTSSIASRVRSSIAGVLPCDLSTEEVFAELRCPSSPVDILIASLVFDVVCVDANQLEVMINRALRWLKPEGLMLVQGSLGEYHYTVGSASMPVLDIQEKEFRAVIDRVGLDVIRWETTVRLTTHYYTVLRRKNPEK